MTTINKISKEQEALIPQFFNEYLGIGLSTEPINIEAMKPVIEAWYRHIKQPNPAYFVFSSPALCSIFCAAVLPQLDSQFYSQFYSQLYSQFYSQLRSQLRSQLYSQLNSQLYSQFYSQLRSQLRSQLDSQLRSQLYSQLDSQLRSQLYSQLDSQLRSQLNSQLYSQLRSQLRSQLYSQLLDTNYWYTNLASSWISYYRCGEMWGVQYTPEVKTYLEQWDTMARNGFHWWPRVGVAVCSQRPTYISIVDKQLHADGRMAVEFSDGWGVYSFRGVRMPEKYGSVQSADWSPEWVLTEENQEIKRVLLENIDREKLWKVLELKTLDTFKTDVSTYELVEAKNNPFPSPYRALKMECPSTGKPYLIRVEPDMTSAEAALVKFNLGVHPDRFVVEH